MLDVFFGMRVLFVPTEDADANVLSIALGCGMSTAAVDAGGGSGGAIPTGGGGSPGGNGGPPVISSFRRIQSKRDENVRQPFKFQISKNIFQILEFDTKETHVT